MSGIVVIDYGMGNLHSIAKALERVAGGEHTIRVSYDPDEIARASHVVFPGVGAIAHCIDEIKRLGLDQSITEAIKQKPVLAICVGLQALMSFSEENNGTECLGVFDGQVKRFEDGLTDPTTGEALKVPHMGWNRVHLQREHPVFDKIDNDERFYFVHSYYVEATDQTKVLATSAYPNSFNSVLAQKNLVAVQFHPEKSQHAGLRLLGNFCRWNGDS